TACGFANQYPLVPTPANTAPDPRNRKRRIEFASGDALFPGRRTYRAASPLQQRQPVFPWRAIRILARFDDDGRRGQHRLFLPVPRVASRLAQAATDAAVG